MAEPDYYAVLGVERSATPAAIKGAYRALARRYHPDLNPGASALDHRFQDVARAYTILGDPARRAAYDGGRVLAQRLPPSASVPAPAAHWAWERPHPYWIADRPARPQLGSGREATIAVGAGRYMAAAPRRSRPAALDVVLCVVLAVALGALCGVLFTAVASGGHLLPV